MLSEAKHPCRGCLVSYPGLRFFGRFAPSGMTFYFFAYAIA